MPSSGTAEYVKLALAACKIAAAAITAQLNLPDIEGKGKPKRRPIPDHIPRMEMNLTPVVIVLKLRQVGVTCLNPQFDGAIFSREEKDAQVDKFVTYCCPAGDLQGKSADKGTFAVRAAIRRSIARHGLS